MHLPSLKRTLATQQPAATKVAVLNTAMKVIKLKVEACKDRVKDCQDQEQVRYLFDSEEDRIQDQAMYDLVAVVEECYKAMQGVISRIEAMHDEVEEKSSKVEYDSDSE